MSSGRSPNDDRKRRPDDDAVYKYDIGDLNNNRDVKMPKTEALTSEMMDVDSGLASSSQSTSTINATYGDQPAEIDDITSSARSVRLDPIDAGPFIPATMAKKPERGQIQRNERAVRLCVNMVTLEQIRKEHQYIYRYNILITPIEGTGADKHIQKRGQDDHCRTHKREACHQLFKKFVARHHSVLNRNALIYDRNNTVHSLVKLNELPLSAEAMEATELDDRGKEVSLGKYDISLVEAKEGALKWDMLDNEHVTDVDLAERDRTFEQFCDLLTSQKTFDENRHKIYAGGTMYRNEEHPVDSGAARFKVEGINKSVKMLDDGRGGIMPALQVEIKKGQVFYPHDLHITAMLIMHSVQNQRFGGGGGGGRGGGRGGFRGGRGGGGRGGGGYGGGGGGYGGGGGSGGGNDVPSDSEVKRWFEDLMHRNRDVLNRSDMDLLNKQCKGMRVITTHRKGKQCEFIIRKLTQEPATRMFFEQDGKQISVAKYFEDQYRIRLRYPQLPLGIRQNMQTKRKEYYPMECLRVMDWQRVTVPQQLPHQQQTMIRESALHPERRIDELGRQLQELGLDSANKFLQAFKMKVSKHFIELEGKQMAALRIKYANTTEAVSSDGNWQGRGQFLVGGGVNAWGCLYFGEKRGDKSPWDDENQPLYQFIEMMESQGRQRGLKLGKTIGDFLGGSYCSASGIQRKFEVMKTKGFEYVLCVMRAQDEDLKGVIKYYEAQTGIITQVVMERTIDAVIRQGKRLTMDNIIAKANMKLGGLNYLVEDNANLFKMWMSDDVMFVGYDVSHPDPVTRQMRRKTDVCSEPSVVGMCATVSNEKMKFCADYYLQDGHQHEIMCAKTLMRVMIDRYAKHHGGRIPSRVVIYRDGASETDFKSVLQRELSRVKQAFIEFIKDSDMKGLEEPTFTLVVSTKKHDLRMFLNPVPQGHKASEKNIKCGTVADHTIIGPDWQFYLCSHQTPQGTAKAIKYTVLRDENKFTNNALQQLTFLLAHGHQIITKTVSLPAPVMVAKIAANRGRNLYKAHLNMSEGASSVGGESNNTNWDDLSAKLRVSEQMALMSYWA